jgi:site-specific DNA-methyltransferase (adenine-specific)
MTPENLLDGRVLLYCGDCLVALDQIEENSIDSVCTDPPYHLISIVKRFGKENSAPINNADEKAGRNGPYHRVSKGFMGKQWDGGDVAFNPETWAKVYRVLKPGAHLLAFGGTRTYHRMACAIEDAGFEIRDCIQWLYGSGFPKSHDVSKDIDRAAGIKRGTEYRPNKLNEVYGNGMGGGAWNAPNDPPATDAARQWDGWGTALKPACEPIVLARKPLSESTVAANVLKWGTGALNINTCRIEAEPRSFRNGRGLQFGGVGNTSHKRGPWQSNAGRWPANIILDGSEEVVAAFPESAARFFYHAKANKNDRAGSKHPTVKPVDLIQYLIRLVTPKGGTVLDPFAGSGTAGEAAHREGVKAVLIEREAEYQNDIRARLTLAADNDQPTLFDERRTA